MRGRTCRRKKKQFCNLFCLLNIPLATNHQSYHWNLFQLVAGIKQSGLSNLLSHPHCLCSSLFHSPVCAFYSLDTAGRKPSFPPPDSKQQKWIAPPDIWCNWLGCFCAKTLKRHRILVYTCLLTFLDVGGIKSSLSCTCCVWIVQCWCWQSWSIHKNLVNTVKVGKHPLTWNSWELSSLGQISLSPQNGLTVIVFSSKVGKLSL